jgi:sulfatase maturation enzyme AslB (radical SAM superfamily)
LSRKFQERVAFGEVPAAYSLLPFKFISLDGTREILVNEVGEHAVVPRGTARVVTRRELDTTSELYRLLRARQFLFDDQSSPLLDVLATKYRTKRAFLDGFTKLHIFVVTLRCDHSCHYCQVSRQTADRVKYDMTEETAERAVDLMFRSPSPQLTLEFQGGEPLLNFGLIRFIVSRCKERAVLADKKLSIVVATNLALATDEMLCFFRDEGIQRFDLCGWSGVPAQREPSEARQ